MYSCLKSRTLLRKSGEISIIILSISLKVPIALGSVAFHVPVVVLHKDIQSAPIVPTTTVLRWHIQLYESSSYLCCHSVRISN
jgi:hypothetical protein